MSARFAVRAGLTLIDQTFETNVIGTMAVTQAFAPMLVRTAAADRSAMVRLVNIGSSAGAGQSMPWV